MKKRAIILDFTSLLDVIMIILFFFILFSHFETEEAKIAMQEAQESAYVREEEARALLNRAADLMAEAIEKNEIADVKLSEAEKAEERAGENAAAINDFSNSHDIRIKLSMSGDENGWRLDIFRDEEKTASIPKADIDSMTQTLIGTFSDMGCDKEDTLLCTFVYNAAESGTNSACNDVSNVFGEVKKQYEHFFYSEVDTSLFEEE